MQVKRLLSVVAFERSYDENGEYVCNLKLIDLTEVANTEKKVPDNMINADGNGMTDDFFNYVLPLIQGAPEIPFEGGLPRFARLKKVLANK